jgi:DNA replication and repair protein RecF
MDFVAMQIEPGYRAALRDYERALRSRNLLLKASPLRWQEIAAFNEPLVETGQRVAAARERLVAHLSEPVTAAHWEISGGGREALRCEYVSGSSSDFAAALHAAREDDARWRQTSVGPHRDDLNFFLNDMASAYASEGQQRTLVLALKLGAARLLADHFAAPPLLLLDDTFGELDVSRRNALLSSFPPASQKLITTTHLDWMPGADAERVIRLGHENRAGSP